MEIVFTDQILTITICSNLVRNFVLDLDHFSTIELFITKHLLYEKSWSENFCNICRKTPVLESHYFEIFTKKYLCWSLFLKELQARRAATLLNRYSNTGVFLWICKTLKNTYFEVHLQIIASGMLLECYFFHTKTDFLFVQEDSFALTGVFL